MIPGESKGTERTARPFSRVVWRIGNGKIGSVAEADVGAAPAESPTSKATQEKYVSIRFS
jgi:hypothetical protein